MKTILSNNLLIGLLFSILFISCEDFLEVDLPRNRMVSEGVFNDDKMAISAMNGIYNQLFTSAFSNGGDKSITVISALSSGELVTNWEVDDVHREFEQNGILPNNPINLGLWSSAYNIIYLTNTVLEGIEKSESLSDSVSDMLRGEALFVRAFTYFYLVNLYGEVPLALTTDYRYNNTASPTNIDTVYHQLITDLTEAITLLAEDYRDGDRTRINRSGASALLARINLFLKNWEEAERLSSLIINSDHYNLLDDLNRVFLANSDEAIWQISPLGGGGRVTYTNEGYTFLFDPEYPSLSKVSLSHEIPDLFSSEDKRLINWIDYNKEFNKFFPTKYKDGSSTNNVTEYSMVLRLAEQFLIRAEAQAQQGNLSEAIADIDIIRTRAGLSPVSEIYPNLEQEELLDVISKERKRELFTEWGHSWLHLKRTGNPTSIIRVEDLLYPIPEEERLKNPNLGQNPGY